MLAALCASALVLHTYHSSVTQIDHISSRKTLEVMLFIHAEDLEAIYRQRAGRNATLDRQREAERFVQGYLKEVFEIRTSEGKLLSLKWVGMEVRTHFVAVYVEVPTPEGLAGLTLKHRLLLDFLPDQVNVVKVKQDGADRRDLTFDNVGAPPVQPLGSLQVR